MKNIILFLLFNLLSNHGLEAQIVHSPNAIEYSVGLERFSQFVAQEIDSLGQSPPVNLENFSWRPIYTGRFRRNSKSGNYFAFGLSFGMSDWAEQIRTKVKRFNNLGAVIMEETIIEQNKEITAGLSYQYSFLMNKKQNSNFQFFIGGGIEAYYDFASKENATRTFFLPRLRRVFLGARISVRPELSYSIPNSRLILSLRTIMPLANFRNGGQSFRKTSLEKLRAEWREVNEVLFLPLEYSRIELGISYFFMPRNLSKNKIL